MANTPDDEFYRTHPALCPMPRDKDARKALLEESAISSVLRGEMLRRKFISDLVAAAEESQRMRVLHDEYAETYDLRADDFVRNAAYLRQGVATAHAAVAHLLHEYLPRRIAHNLQMVSDVGTTSDPIELIMLGRKSTRESLQNPRDVIAHRMSFEVGRQMWLAQLEFEAAFYGLSVEVLTSDMRRFIALLEERFFDRGNSARVILEADLDPANQNRVVGEPTIRRPDESSRELPRGLTRYQLPLDVRYVRVGEELVPVFFDTRVKQYLSLKLTRKGLRDPRAIHDLSGIKLVIFHAHHRRAIVDAFRLAVANRPGTVFAEASSLGMSGALESSHNPYSAQYRALKFILLKFGRYSEIQFELASDWINQMASRGVENHDLYKQRSYAASLLPRLWPFDIYGVDWNDEGLLTALRDMTIARIG